MKTLRFIALINIVLTIGQLASGATLASQVDARRSSGTATGTFVNNELPAFLLSALGGTFGIRNAASAGGPQWEFAVGSGGSAKVAASPTVRLSEISSFSSSHLKIDIGDITYSADRSHPTDIRFLFGKSGGNYYALEVALWENTGKYGTKSDRLRFYGASRAEMNSDSTSLTVVPEPTSAMSSGLTLAFALTRRKR